MIIKEDSSQQTIFFKRDTKHWDLSALLPKIGGVITKRYQGFTDTLDKHHISLTPDHVYDIEKMEPSEIIDSILQDNVLRVDCLSFPMKLHYSFLILLILTDQAKM